MTGQAVFSLNQSSRLTNPGFTHSHVIPGTVAVRLYVQVREVEEDAVADLHHQHPGTVHAVGVAVGVQRGVDLP